MVGAVCLLSVLCRGVPALPQIPGKPGPLPHNMAPALIGQVCFRVCAWLQVLQSPGLPDLFRIASIEKGDGGRKPSGPLYLIIKRLKD